MRKNRWTLAGAAVAIPSAFWLATVSSVATTEGVPTIASVSADKLALHGITVLAPNRLPTTTRDQALAAGRRSEGEDFATPPVVRQILLARVVKTTPPTECLCWVVSLDPSGYRPLLPFAGARQAPFTFYVEYVDAITGRWLFTDAGT